MKWFEMGLHENGTFENFWLLAEEYFTLRDPGHLTRFEYLLKKLIMCMRETKRRAFVQSLQLINSQQYGLCSQLAVFCMHTVSFSVTTNRYAMYGLVFAICRFLFLLLGSDICRILTIIGVPDLSSLSLFLCWKLLLLRFISLAEQDSLVC